MIPKHHPDDSTLLSYSAGSLPLGAQLLLECHLACCEYCRARVDECDTLGGTLLEGLPSAAISTNSQDIFALLDTIESNADNKSLTAPNKEINLPFDLPDWGLAIKDWFAEYHSDDDIQWQKLAPGISQIKLESDAFKRDKAVRLLKISPGTCMPSHGHSGSELTLILDGSYSDEVGRFCAGDVADLDPEVIHQPIADRDKPCICFIATDAPLKFEGWIPKLMQPFFGL